VAAGDQLTNAVLGPDLSDDDNLSVDSVHDALRTAILRGELAPGVEVSQVQLATQLGVSRTPLREALRLLQREGLVESRRNRRVRVAPLSIADFDELYAIRLAIETTALRLSVPLLSPEELADLSGLMAQMAHFAATEDYERWEVPHRSFHAGLVGYSGERMVRLIAELADHATRYRWLYMSAPKERGSADAEHRAILDAVSAGDADAAAVRLARHLARTPMTVMPEIDADYEPRAIRQALLDITGSAKLPPRRA
jgi:DNA-binding GntR family transcriptional regulator